MEYFTEKIPKEIIETYTKLAEAVGIEFYKKIAKEVAILNPETLLDIGTGPGILLKEIAKLCKAHIIGIDCTKEFGRYVKKYNKDFKNRVKFIAGNGYMLPFKDNIFDVIVCIGVLHALKDPEELFKEIYRVLKFGGYVLIKDPTPLKISDEEAKKILNEKEIKIFRKHKEFEKKCFGSEIPGTFEPEEVKIFINRGGNFKKIMINKKDGVLSVYLQKL